MTYSAQHLSQEPLRADVDTQAGWTVLEFGTPWCPHCLGAQPLIEAALGPRADIRHLKVEDGPGRPLGRSYRVKLWPTLVLLRDGQEVARVVRPTDGASMAAMLAALPTP
ncbi:thioredoxin 1 [Comamonas sp. BIGb0152]|uniref:thioredoxin family protein n=1 Tax=Comamonas sp. BIGb0152 TaxID=2940601 RepID=UPI0021688844|nr:thioredoxin family protein [Comamonas sp. BIGb0152]MCS4293082.1 thioredoxin 1 [Comamonas sp. BIGb0152]